MTGPWAGVSGYFGRGEGRGASRDGARVTVSEHTGAGR